MRKLNYFLKKYINIIYNIFMCVYIFHLSLSLSNYIYTLLHTLRKNILHSLRIFNLILQCPVRQYVHVFEIIIF